MRYVCVTVSALFAVQHRWFCYFSGFDSLVKSDVANSNAFLSVCLVHGIIINNMRQKGDIHDH